MPGHMYGLFPPQDEPDRPHYIFVVDNPALPAITPDDVSTWEPAITPTVSDGTVRTFTADDVRSWLLAHPPRVRRSLEVFEIAHVLFMTAAEAERKIWPTTAFGLAPDAPVWFVKLYGHIEMPGVRPGAIDSGYRHVEEVLDATTGNILVLRPAGTPVGIEAITTRHNPLRSSPPVFTVDDACTYVRVNWLRIEEEFTKMRGVGASHVMGVQFLPSVQANQVLDTTLGLAPDALVCVVELHGFMQENLTYQEIAERGGVKNRDFTVLYLAFDARTGNFLGFHAPLSSLWEPLPPTGVPAITPTRDLVPSFTAQDVRDYFSSHECVDLSGVMTPQPITQIVFTTTGELHRVIGGGNFMANYGPDKPICCVELSGTFHPIGVPGPRSPEPSMKTFDTYYRIFDAVTGNSLATSMTIREK